MDDLQKVDVMIVGAGPAGVSTWLHLKKHAPELADRALLIDKAAFPRPKLCGGGVWAWCEDILADLEIDIAEIPGLLRSEVVFGFQGRTWVYPSPRPFRMVRRDDFDMVLVEAALARGACLREKESFRGAQYRADGFAVETSRGRYQVKVLVGADGAMSTVRRVVMAPAPFCLAPAIQASAPVPAACDQDPLEIDFSAVADGLQGYVWHFPCLQNGAPAMHHGIVDFRISKEAARPHMQRLFRRELRRRQLAIEETVWSRHPIRWLAPEMPIAAPRVLLAGDAAGIEPALGGGIHLALSYGAFAARQLKAAFEMRDFSFEGCQAALRSHPVGRHIDDFSRLARAIYSRKNNPLDEVRDFFTDRLMRSKLASLLHGQLGVETV